MYGQIFTVIAPIFIMTFVGFVFGSFQKQFDTRAISSLVLMIATPCLVFSKLTSLAIDPATLGTMMLSALMCATIAAALGLPVLMASGQPVRTFLPSLMLPNSGNIGLPLVLLAFGDEGLILGISYFFVIALLQYTLGAAIASGHYHIREIAKQPLVWSISLVMIVIFTGWKVPPVIATSADILGGMMIPAMLVMLGVSLSRLRISDMGPAIVIAVARLVIGLIAGYAVIRLLGLTGIEAGTVFLLAVMPTAIVTYVFAERYRPDGQKVAGAVVASTLFTFALLPGLIWLTYWIAGVDVS